MDATPAATPDTTTAAPPDAVFSPDDDLAALWGKAYQGEVSGEALFGTFAALTTDAEQRRKMEVLARLEARTREACVPAMDRNGFPTEADAQTVADAEALAAAAVTIPWNDFMGAFEAITTQFIDLYERIGAVAAADVEESALLVAHEIALREFARRELAGHTTDSLALIEALPHMQTPAAS